MRRNWIKTGRIYIKLYISIFIRKNFSYPPKVLLGETLYFVLSKNLVICFKGTLALLLLDTTKSSHSCLLLLNLKQGISLYLLKVQISGNHLNPPKTICKHPKPSTTIQNHPPENIYNRPKPTITTQSYPQSARIYLQLAVTGLKTSISMWEHPQSFTKHLRTTLVFMWNSALRQKFNFCISEDFC